METELLVNTNQQFIECARFANDLIFGAENMRIILYKTANTHQSMQCTTRLIAMARTKFSQTHRQITVRAQAVIENLNMSGTVHRFNRIFAFFRTGYEHIIFVVIPMTGFFPKGFIHDLGSFDFFITGSIQFFTHMLLNSLPQSPTFGMPKHHTRRFVLQVEQIQLLTQFAMVAFFCFFNALDIGF